MNVKPAPEMTDALCELFGQFGNDGNNISPGEPLRGSWGGSVWRPGERRLRLFGVLPEKDHV